MFKQLKRLTGTSLIAAIAVGTIGIKSGEAGSFSFSDFDFKRAEDHPTTFHTTTYPDDAGTGVEAFKQFVQAERVAVSIDTLNARKLDPTKLKLTQNYDVKIYFIDEGAGYKNQLYLDTIDASGKDGMIFYDGSRGKGSKKLRRGDYVELGTIPNGATLDFQLRANGYNNDNPDVWYADIARNSDNTQHVMAFEYQGYLILAWEDLKNGGDKDYNDIVFAVDIGSTNLASIASLPEANSAPVAVNDLVTTPSETEIGIDVLNNDTDAENHTLTLTGIDDLLTEGGVVSMSGDQVVYTPDYDFSGTDTFIYTIEDSEGATDTATVTVTVEASLEEESGPGCSNNGHGNNGPMTISLPSGELTIGHYDPSNPSGSQRTKLIDDLENGRFGDSVPNNRQYYIEFTGSSYSFTASEAENIVNNLPDWEMIDKNASATGIHNCPGNDQDGDSINDAIEIGSNVYNPVDTDGDGTPDYLDLDSNNDGINDGVAVSCPVGSTVTLTGTLRDFSDAHPDFERKPGVNGFKYGLDTGITTASIGSDRKPVYVGGSYSTTTKTNFDQWYRDVEGINESMDYDITLTKNDAGL